MKGDCSRSPVDLSQKNVGFDARGIDDINAVNFNGKAVVVVVAAEDCAHVAVFAHRIELAVIVVTRAGLFKNVAILYIGIIRNRRKIVSHGLVLSETGVIAFGNGEKLIR